MRLFIAVELEKDVIDALCSLHEELKGKADEMRFVPLQNLHLTLFFLGNTPENKLAEISKALQSLGENNLPFKLEFSNRLETFDAKNPARVVWVGVKSDLPALRKLQAMIAATMHKMGFLRTEKTYIPHITVGRDVHFKDEYIIKGNNNNMFKAKIPQMLVDKISLIESSLENGKRIYKTLARFDFKLSGKQE